MVDFRFSAASTLLLISFSGLLLNLLVIIRMRREKEGFHKICINKAVANILIVCAYLIWAVPCSYLNAYYLPPQFNIFFGQIIGWGPYLMSGPFTQICLAINRSVAISYPYWFDRQHRLPFTTLALTGLWILAVLVSLPSMKEGCSFIFYPEVIAWGTMSTPCSLTLSSIFLTSVIIMTVISFSINVSSIFKILKLSMTTGSSLGISAARNKRRRRMFVQCIIQDCTHSFDTFVNNYIYFLYSAQ